MNDDILRFTSFGCTYRLKLSNVMYLGSEGFYKFLAAVCNQETREKSIQTLEQILPFAVKMYDEEVKKEAPAMAFTVALKRLEKNMYRISFLHGYLLNEIKGQRVITEAEIRRRCQSNYRNVYNKTMDLLISIEGINFPVFSDMYMSGGTPMTLLYCMDNDLIDMEVVEKRRRYEIDKERRPTN